MAAIKTALKAAKAALDAHNYDDAIEQAHKVLSMDSDNYFGYASELQYQNRHSK